MRTYLALFFFSALLSWSITPAVRSLACRLKAFGGAGNGDEGAVVPRLGGLAVLAATLLSWSALFLLDNALSEKFRADLDTLVLLLLPASLVLALGVYDDLVGTKPWQKLSIQLVAASMVWWGGFRITKLPILGYDLHYSVVSFFLTVLWIIAVTNSFNLIDGLDGLAAGIAFFVNISVFVVSLLQEQYVICIIAVTLAGSLLGFLKFNFFPAQIYLGDTGSLFLGFLLASLAIHTSQKGPTLLAIVVPFVAFGLPLLDTMLTVVRRFLGGRPLFTGDREHIHHRVLEKSLSPQLAVLGLYALAALFSLGSLLIVRSTGNLIALVALLAGVSAWFLTKQLNYDELSELNIYVTRAMQSQRRVLANQIMIRKASRLVHKATDLEQAWAVFRDALEVLDFDGARLEISESAGVKGPLEYEWRREGVQETGDSWTVSLPVCRGRLAVGEVRVWRSRGKDRLLFQFSSLVDTLLPPLEQQLADLAEQSVETGHVAAGTPQEASLEPSVIERD